jgi:hypothetical protein
MDVIDRVYADQLEVGDIIRINQEDVEITDFADEGEIIYLTFDNGKEKKFSPLDVVDLLGYTYTDEV